MTPSAVDKEANPGNKLYLRWAQIHSKWDYYMKSYFFKMGTNSLYSLPKSERRWWQAGPLRMMLHCERSQPLPTLYVYIVPHAAPSALPALFRWHLPERRYSREMQSIMKSMDLGTWVQIPVLPLTSHVNLGRWQPLFVSELPCWFERTMVDTW